MDISGDKILSGNFKKRVETSRFGPFTFQVGVDESVAPMLLQRVTDAQERFLSSPLSQVADRLEQEVLVSSVFSTNTIEGGTLTEKKRRMLSTSTLGRCRPRNSNAPLTSRLPMPSLRNQRARSFVIFLPRDNRNFRLKGGNFGG